MKKKYLVYAIITIFFLFLIFSRVFFSQQTFQWGSAIRWHLFNEETLTFHNMRLTVPYRWWVVSSNKNKLGLSVVLPHEHDFTSFLFFNKKVMSKEQLYSLKSKKNIGEDEIEFYKVETKAFGDEKAFGIIYKVVNYSASEQIIPVYEFWTIPSKGLVFSTTRLLNKHEEIFLELFSSISFT